VLIQARIYPDVANASLFRFFSFAQELWDSAGRTLKFIHKNYTKINKIVAIRHTWS
jgi:hypothetical protein